MPEAKASVGYLKNNQIRKKKKSNPIVSLTRTSSEPMLQATGLHTKHVKGKTLLARDREDALIVSMCITKAVKKSLTKKKKKNNKNSFFLVFGYFKKTRHM